MKPLRTIAIIAGAAVLSLPVFITFIISPAFTRVVEENAKEESVRAAAHLSSMLLSEEAVIRKDRMSVRFSAEAEEVRKDFNAMKIKVYSAAGEVVYSSSPEETGEINMVQFSRMAAGGGVYCEIVRKAARTLEGKTASLDVAETYVPLIRNGAFAGAFEIYYDVSGRLMKLNEVKTRAYGMLSLAVLGLIASAGAGLYHASKGLAERDRARKQWEDTFNAVTDPVMLLDSDFRILRANKAMADFLGVSSREAVGMTCYRHVHCTDGPIPDCPHRKLLADGMEHAVEIYEPRVGKYYSVAVFPITDTAGRLTATVHYARDITIRKKAEESLREAEAKYRIVADNTYAWEFWLTPEGQYVYSSPSCERITGYHPGEFAADPALFVRIVHDEDRQRVIEHQLAAQEKVAPGEIVFRILRRDGQVRWISHICQPLFDPDGNYIGIRGSNSDVTERERMNRALKESAYTLAEAQRMAHIGSWELDMIRNELTWSDEIYRIFEIDPAVFGASYEAFLDLVHPDDRALVNEAYSRSLRDRIPYEVVHRLRMRDGRIKHVRERCESLYDADGRPVRSIGTVQDISEQIMAEEVLRESEEKFKGLAASAQDAIVMMDGRGNISYWNESASRIFGYSSEEALGRQLHNILSPRRYNDEYLKGYAHFRETGDGPFIDRILELSAMRKDGTEFPVEFSVSKLMIRGEWHAISILRDISDRKKTENLMRQQVRNMTALTDIGIAISSSLDIRVTLNILLDRLTSQLGIDAADVLLLDQDTLCLTSAASLGFRTSSIREISVRLGKGHAGRAAYERRTLILSDLGDTLTHALRDEQFRGYIAVPLIAKGNVKGVIEIFHRNTIEPTAEWLSFLELMAAQAAIAIENATMFDSLQRANTELALSYDTTLEGWGRTLEFRDEDTMGHTERVSGMAVRFARLMGMEEKEVTQLRRGAFLHDIGKIGIPDSILLKPGALTPEEREIMQKHPGYAYELLYPIPFLRPALDIPYYHHEKWNGKGYPKGLRGEDIPLAARIFAVVDVWDALSSSRPYRQGWPVEKVREYIVSLSGIEFDPAVVEVFLKVLDEEEHVTT
ncbi:MAG: PAS domain S-box protein [Nitrospirae bacterium]|nr:MAG: PAS domain S-box protein [Nitrospirota bacterium]